MDIMNQRATFLLALLSVISVIFGAQSQSNGQADSQVTQMRGFWVDPSSGLMWAGKDNGQNVTWKNAVKYCRDLRLGGYSDWRLATIDELQGISIQVEHDSLPARDGVVVEYVHAGRAKGGLHLTSSQTWSSSKRQDDRGQPTGYAWFFDFPHGQPSWDPLGYQAAKRALCVRRP